MRELTVPTDIAGSANIDHSLGRSEDLLGLLEEFGGAGCVVGGARIHDDAHAGGCRPEAFKFDFDAASGLSCLDDLESAARLDRGDRHAHLGERGDDGGLDASDGRCEGPGGARWSTEGARTVEGCAARNEAQRDERGDFHRRNVVAKSRMQQCRQGPSKFGSSSMRWWCRPSFQYERTCF